MWQSLAILNFLFLEWCGTVCSDTADTRTKNKRTSSGTQGNSLGFSKYPPPPGILNPVISSLSLSLSVSLAFPFTGWTPPGSPLPLQDSFKSRTHVIFFRGMSAPQTGVSTFLWRKRLSQRLFVWLRNVPILLFEGMTLKTTTVCWLKPNTNIEYIYDVRIPTVVTENIFRFIRAADICSVSLLLYIQTLLVTKYI